MKMLKKDKKHVLSTWSDVYLFTKTMLNNCSVTLGKKHVVYGITQAVLDVLNEDVFRYDSIHEMDE